MTYLFNDPADFAAELLDGYAAAYSAWVTPVRGGVVRTLETRPGEVAVVNGGGSGHFPAFAGLVGPGLVHGTAMGNIFASPSAAQVYEVASQARSDSGVLFVVCNYAGDVLNFTEAGERLKSEGVDVETVLVTDDISSAPPAERGSRRGIAGGLTVYKAAGAAAAAGLPLTSVAEVAREANERTRTLGLAFTGCTFPGASEPHFTVPDGMMALGMGIHGEPGIEMVPMSSADSVAALLVERLLQELPPGVDGPDGQRVAVILNGLGSVKYEELFVTYRSVSRLLESRGVTIVQPEVGEFVTSFQMAGLSLTLTWLTERLESLWAAPASSPAYRKGAVSAPTGARRTIGTGAEDRVAVPAGGEGSRGAARALLAMLAHAVDVIAEREHELGRLDSVAGDGDHGIGMRRGIAAARDAAVDATERGAGVGTALRWAGDAWADRGAGTSGALWGTMLRAAGDALGDETVPSAHAVVLAVEAACQAAMARGGAAVGDKTMMDAIVPFSETLRRAVSDGRPLAEALPAASAAARTAADATAELVARRGRARSHAEGSRGAPDPGAVSFAAIVAAATAIVG